MEESKTIPRMLKLFRRQLSVYLILYFWTMKPSTCTVMWCKYQILSGPTLPVSQLTSLKLSLFYFCGYKLFLIKIHSLDWGRGTPVLRGIQISKFIRHVSHISKICKIWVVYGKIKWEGGREEKERERENCPSTGSFHKCLHASSGWGKCQEPQTHLRDITLDSRDTKQASMKNVFMFVFDVSVYFPGISGLDWSNYYLTDWR